MSLKDTLHEAIQALATVKVEHDEAQKAVADTTDRINAAAKAVNDALNAVLNEATTALGGTPVPAQAVSEVTGSAELPVA